MSENQKTRTPEEEQQARMKRSIGVVVIGVVMLALFYYMIGGVTELYTADMVPTSQE